MKNMETSHQNKSTESANAEVPTSCQHCGNALLPDALLFPRYKVIADYPMNRCNVGDILDHFSGDSFILKGVGLTTSIELDKYPHLFKKLEWWEERKVEEMPEYVKCHNPPEIRKVIAFDTVHFLPQVCITLNKSFADYDREYVLLSDCLPATEQEYLSYIEGLKK